MKKILLVLLAMATIESFAQNDVKLIKVNGKYKIEYNGKEFDANENILTIKPKFSSWSSSISGIKIIRGNKLGFFDIKIPDNKDIEEYAEELKKTGLFETVEFNAYGEYSAFIPNDSLISNQWHLSNINMYNAWDFVKGNASVVVGILDSGIDWEHVDMGMGSDSYQNIYLNPGEDAWGDVNNPTTGNGIDDDGNGLIDDWKGWNYANNSNDSRPSYFHGTFVAGIASAKTNNRVGIAGVSGGNNNPGIKLLPYCIGLTAPDGSIVDDAILDAVDIGVKVINLSISISSTPAINSAIQYAINNDVIVVASSGNDSSSSVSYPASNSNVIAVGATASNNTRASFSNYGVELDLVAPGVDIYSTTLNDDYTTSSGTSYAAPQVSAVAALLFSINSDLTAQEVRNILESTAQKVSGYTYTATSGHPNGTWNDQMGYGLLNAYAALNSVRPYFLLFGPVCNSGKSVTMFNVPDGASIIWNQSSNILRSSPQGSNPCTFSASGYWASGAGSIGATVITACGDSIIVPPIAVWAGVPDYNQLSVEITSDRLVACGYTEGEANFNGSPSPGIDAFQWDLDATDYDVEEVGMSLVDYKYVEIHYWEDPAPYDEYIWISAHNQCGWSMSKRTTWLVEDECDNDWYLVFSPNPATGKTMLTIESNSTEKTFDVIAEWDLEIYTQTQMLKDRKIKLKGNSTTINTSGWKEGVYVARVKYKDEVLTDKLVVKQ